MKKLDRKQYLELFRLETGLKKEEFYPALGRLLKDKVVRFSDKPEKLPVA